MSLYMYTANFLKVVLSATIVTIVYVHSLYNNTLLFACTGSLRQVRHYWDIILSVYSFPAADIVQFVTERVYIAAE